MTDDRIDLHKLSTLPPAEVKEKEVREKTVQLLQQLKDFQAKLYAQAKYAVLVIVQGMDASGKDGAVKNVFSGVNPAGCRVKSFKVPTEEERKHDFLWRIHRECPEKGMIQIFNRSHYEDILVPSVYKLLDKDVIKKRFGAINAFEKLLKDHDTIIFKFYLHVSEKEQLERINERLTDPMKRWKYQEEDIVETRHRGEYMHVYEKIFRHCDEVPWTIVPSDKNWYKNYYILHTIVKELSRYDIRYPHEY